MKEARNLPIGAIVKGIGGESWKVEMGYNQTHLVNQKTGEVLISSDIAGLTEKNGIVRVIIPNIVSPNYRKLLKGHSPQDMYNRMEKPFRPNNKKEYDDEYRSRTGAIWKNATAEEKKAISHYTGAGYRKINRDLRDGNKNEEAKILENIISRSKLHKDTTLYRGISKNALANMFGLSVSELDDIPISEFIGGDCEEEGFCSCGSVPGAGFNDKKVQIEILAPKGTKAMYIEPVSSLGSGDGVSWNGESVQSKFSQEFETLLSCNTGFRYISADYDNGRYKLKLCVTHQLKTQWLE